MHASCSTGAGERSCESWLLCLFSEELPCLQLAELAACLALWGDRPPAQQPAIHVALPASSPCALLQLRGASAGAAAAAALGNLVAERCVLVRGCFRVCAVADTHAAL